jgi:hypothetical protein
MRLLGHEPALLSLGLQFFIPSALILKFFNGLEVITLLLGGFDEANVVLVTRSFRCRHFAFKFGQCV